MRPQTQTRTLIGITLYPYNAKLIPGGKGTVHCVDDMGTIHVQWDCGSSLGLIPGEDDWKKITE